MVFALAGLSTTTSFMPQMLSRGLKRGGKWLSKMALSTSPAERAIIPPLGGRKLRLRLERYQLPARPSRPDRMVELKQQRLDRAYRKPGHADEVIDSNGSWAQCLDQSGPIVAGR